MFDTVIVTESFYKLQPTSLCVIIAPYVLILTLYPTDVTSIAEGKLKFMYANVKQHKHMITVVIFIRFVQDL